MNEDYLMRAGDKFVARECGCAMSVISGPSEASMAVSPPKCCCGHVMTKEAGLIGEGDVLDIPEPRSTSQLLPGMAE
jgi:hypothetical protein